MGEGGTVVLPEFVIAVKVALVVRKGTGQGGGP